jgi:diaminopimelate decarboxylase
MPHFEYRDGLLCAEQATLPSIAERFGTPCYVYSRAAIEGNWRAWRDAFGARPHLLAYAVKANGNLAVLRLLADLGAGFDIVSSGELERVRSAGGDPGRVVFSGVGKRADEMQAALEAGIRCFSVESRSELLQLDQVARQLGRQAPVALRVNPDVDARTHPHIATGLRHNKFGIPIEQAAALYTEARRLPGIALHGIACHIGSQVTAAAPYLDALQRLLALVDELRAGGIVLRHVDIGGGLGIRYRDESPPAAAELVAALSALVEGTGLELWMEPGRSIVGDAGLLLTRVLYLKGDGPRRFAVVDTAMNDLLRPSLYDAFHDIVPVMPRGDRAVLDFDVVGPVCESADVLGRGRALALAEGDLLAIRGAGAYAAVMASNYNARPRPAEVMVEGTLVRLVRRRETLAEMLAPEHVRDT